MKRQKGPPIPVEEQFLWDFLTRFNTKEAEALVFQNGGILFEKDTAEATAKDKKQKKQQMHPLVLAVQTLLKAGKNPGSAIPWLNRRSLALKNQMKSQLSGEENHEKLIKACNHEETNYAIQMYIEAGTDEDMEWLICSFNSMLEQGNLLGLMSHGQGCRMLQRLAEFHGLQDEVRNLCTSVLEKHALAMCEDQHAQYVVKEILDSAKKNGWPDAVPLQKKVIYALGLFIPDTETVQRENVKAAMKHEHKSFVLKDLVLRVMDTEELKAFALSIVQTVTERPEVALELTLHQFSQHFVCDIIAEKRHLFEEEYQNLVKHLRPHVDELQRTMTGKKKDQTNRVLVKLRDNMEPGFLKPPLGATN